MADLLEYLRQFNIASVTLRLALAMLCGGLIGLERGQKRRAAGFRTYMLVCLGSALTVLLSQYETALLTTHWNELATELGIRTDVSRFAAQVINGIGFLGAGTIIVTGRQQVKGLTTAAGLWASACMGIAIGAGFYECVLLAFLLIFISIRFLPIVDSFIRENAMFMNIYIEFDSMNNIGTLINRIKSFDLQILDVEIERERKKSGLHSKAIFSIRLLRRQQHTHILSALAELECISLIEEI